MIDSNIIDVDELPDELPSDDSDVQFSGYKRDPSRSETHRDEFEREGLVCTGFKDSGVASLKAPRREKPPRQVSQSSSKTPESDRPSPFLEAPRAGSSAHVVIVRNKSPERAQSTASIGPPAKRQKRTHKPSTTNPTLKRGHAAMQAGSIDSTSQREVICISDSDEEPVTKKPALSKASTSIPEKANSHLRVEREEEENYAAMHAALDVDYQPNWDDAASRLRCQDEEDSEGEDLALKMAELSVAQSANKRQLHRISGLQQQSAVFDWSDSPHLSRKPHVYYMVGVSKVYAQ
ncbi:hypothetical protein C8Q79DRAFT_55483 [Trametes meyenii]|nr:hypothetical protein C8Q79DRAFT_55483 [Trametes meyenii]